MPSDSGTGVLIEAQPTSFEHLLRSPRRVKKVHAAACRRGGNISMSTRSDGISPAIELTTPEYLQRWGRYLGGETVQVRCQELGDVIREAGFSSVDFLTLDVQGAEEAALDTVDPCLFKVGAPAKSTPILSADTL